MTAGTIYSHLFFEVGIAPRKLEINVTREVLEPRRGQRSQFLTSLVPFRMKVVSDRQKGH